MFYVGISAAAVRLEEEGQLLGRFVIQTDNEKVDSFHSIGSRVQ